MLKERQKKIIMMLNNKNWITGKELSEFLNVSDRTIRSDIACINLYYDDILIESNVKNGYHLNSNVSSTLNTHSKFKIPQTSLQRCFYIIHELLFTKNELNLVLIMNKLFVSESCIENDLKKIKEELSNYPTLNFVRQKNYISLEGSEENKRQLYLNLLVRKIKTNFLNLDFLASLFTKVDLFSIKDLMEKIFEKYNYNVRKIEFPIIMAYIGVSLERIYHHNYIQTNKENNNLSNSTEFSISQELFQAISNKLNIKLNKNETAFLAFILLGKSQSNNKKTGLLLLNSDYTINQLVKDILEKIYVEFDVDLRDDSELKQGLSAHIQLLLERKKNNIHISNLYLEELKYKYPFFFEMAIRVSKLIQEKLKINMNENDITFIEQHLGGALERMNSKNKYRVIIMNPNNQALSSLCIKKIETIFHDHIKIIMSINYFEKKQVLKANPDLIITTVPLEHNLNILTVQISPFVNSQDKIKIFETLNLLDSNKSDIKFIKSCTTMIKPDFFYFDLDLDTPKKVLTFMCDKLYDKGLVEKEFKDAVLKREQLSPTSFIYSFAIPHPIIAMSKESKIAVALLKRPIQWGEFQVKLVLLLAIKEGNQKTIKIFFDWLSNMVSNPKKLIALMKTQNYNDFINHIINQNNYKI